MALVRLSRGLGLMIVGFVSKAYFIIFIAPGLLEGEFTQYFFATSIAVIAGRILGFGAREDLVYKIKHNQSRISYYLRGGVIYYFGAFCCMLVTGIFSDVYEMVVLTIAYSLVIAGSNFLIGALRTYNNAFQEFTVNAPWFLVFVFSFLTVIHNANDILLLLLISYGLIFVTNLSVAHLIGIEIQKPSIRILTNQFLRYKEWLPKSLSAAFITADLRSYPIWLGGLGYLVSDGLAYAFVMGELVFQICMVYVHQVHSSLKVQDNFGGMRKFIKTSAIMALVAILIPTPVYQIVTSGYFDKTIDVDYRTIFFASLFCAIWAFFSLLRVFVWRRKISGGANSVLVFQSGFFLLVGASVLLFGPATELLLGVTLLNFISVFVYVHYLVRKDYI